MTTPGRGSLWIWPPGFATGQGRDTITGINDLVGSHYNDRLLGADQNIFNYGASDTGMDYLDGRGSDDVFDSGSRPALGGEGDDLIRQAVCCNPSATNDSFDGGPGQDSCTGGETTICEA